MAENGSTILDIRNLNVDFHSVSGVIHALRGVDNTLRRGETVARVGESGSGKTTIGRCIIGLHQPSAGSIRFDGTELTDTKSKEVREKRTQIQMIFQDPMPSLNPAKGCGISSVRDWTFITNAALPRSAAA